MSVKERAWMEKLSKINLGISLLLLIFSFTLPSQEPSSEAQSKANSIKDSQQDDRMTYLTDRINKAEGERTEIRAKRDAQVEELNARIQMIDSQIAQLRLDEKQDIAAIREENAGNYGMVKGACTLITLLSGAGLFATVRLGRKNKEDKE